MPDGVIKQNFQSEFPGLNLGPHGSILCTEVTTQVQVIVSNVAVSLQVVLGSADCDPVTSQLQVQVLNVAVS